MRFLKSLEKICSKYFADINKSDVLRFFGTREYLRIFENKSRNFGRENSLLDESGTSSSFMHIHMRASWTHCLLDAGFNASPVSSQFKIDSTWVRLIEANASSSVLSPIFFLFLGYAWVTLATNDAYSLGALVLAHSLHRVGTKYELACMVTPGVTAIMRYHTCAH